MLSTIDRLFSMSPSIVELRIRGPRLHPDTMKASDLAQVLVCLEKTIESVADLRPSEDEMPAAVISLTGVRDGSCYLSLTVSPVAWEAVATVCRSVEDRIFARLPRLAQAKLAELSRVFAHRGWEGEFTGRSLPKAIISATNPIPEPPPPRLRGSTTLVGQCIRVGGVQPGVQVRPSKGGKLVTVQAPRELVKELGDRVYETVALEGDAVWDPDTWELIEFRAARVLPYKPNDLLVAFHELAAATGGAWDGVDAGEYVRKARFEDGEGL